jgi:hypothetical protein
MHSLIRAAFSLSMLVLITGCATHKPYHLTDPLTTVMLAPPAGWDVSDTQKLVPPPSPSVAVIEFNEAGKLFSCGDPNCEVARTEAFIRNARKERGTKQLVVITYVHGWHHDASSNSDNFRDFQTMINCLNWGEPTNPNARQQLEEAKGQPAICTGMTASKAYLYVGVYIGWRGESINPKLSAINVLSLFTRHNAAIRVAENDGPDGVERTLLKISEATKQGADPARLILVGHSFGSLIVGRVSTDIFEKRLSLPIAPAAADCSNLGTGLPSFADLIITINPADDSLHMADLTNRFKNASIARTFSPCADASLNPWLKHPLLVALHTSSDSFTDYLGSFALKLGFWMDRDYMHQMDKPWKGRLDQGNWLDHAPSSGELRRTTVSHVTYLRNLCYFDQPNGQDDVCLGLNDTLYGLKKAAYEKTFPAAKAQPPKPFNPNYWPDPYYHGAYELLSSICLETWEKAPTHLDKKHQFEADFDPGKSCADPDLEAKRSDLEHNLRESLKKYLAFPQEEEKMQDDLLLDTYNRIYDGCVRQTSIKADGDNPTPPLCPPNYSAHGVSYLSSQQTGWNDTPFWTINTSYEIIQGHSGFWNSDAFAIVTGIALQFPVASYDPEYNNVPAKISKALSSAPSASGAKRPRGRSQSGQQQQQQQQQQQRR